MTQRRMWTAIKAYTDGLRILCRPLSLSACTVRQGYLLERNGLSVEGGTVFMLAVPYLVTEDAVDPERNVSLYAVPRDYHLFFKELTTDLLPLLKTEFPSYHTAVFADHSPIDEVEAACLAGLGHQGKNGLLLTHEYGSFVFLGEVITNAPFEEAVGSYAEEPPPALCTECGRCIAACPIGCRADRVGCLSALTQQKGTLSETEQAQLAAHPLVWGCDTCQTVCPVNRRIVAEGKDSPVPFFLKQRLVHLTYDVVNGMSDKDFSARAYAWRRRETVLRNLSFKHHTNGGTL